MTKKSLFYICTSAVLVFFNNSEAKLLHSLPNYYENYEKSVFSRPLGSCDFFAHNVKWQGEHCRGPLAGDKVLCQQEYSELTAEGKTVTVGIIMTYNNFFNWKREQIEQQQQLILKTMQERQQKLKKLMEVMTYLKSIEQLKEKRLREYNEEVLAEEQKFLDELGTQLHFRQA